MQDAGQSGVSATEARITAAFERWQGELLDPSRNNRLLHFQVGSRPGAGGRRGQSGVAIQAPDPAELFDRLVNKERRQMIARPPAQEPLPLDDLTTPGDLTPPAPQHGAERGSEVSQSEIRLDYDPARLDALLYRLRLRARSALLEQGVDILYVAFGLLEWTLPGQSERLVSPLLLLPVRLDRARTGDPYTLTPLDESPVLNPALTFQLEQVYKLPLRLPDDGDRDQEYAAALDAVRAGVGQIEAAKRAGWIVEGGAYLGLFSFAKQAMYTDLLANRERFGEHAVVRALAGEPGSLSNLALPDPIHLDEQEPPHDTFQVLDADASQRTVLAAIRKGGNLVVQGPPGTGKSQTIANAIAETLARGKTVLFVSEKLAALQVVARRLRAAGLGSFYLEAHGHGGDKKAIVAELTGALPTEMYLPPARPLDGLTALAERRTQVNAYARALHDHHNPLGATAFAVHGELAKRVAAPQLLFDVPNIGGLTSERTMRLLDLVRKLTPLASVVTAPEQHPWYGCTLTRWTPLVQAQLQTILDRLARAADELAGIQVCAGSRWGLAPEQTLGGARWLLQALAILEERPQTLPAWMERADLPDLTERIHLWGIRCQGYTQKRLTLLSHYQEAVFALDLPTIIHAIERVEVGAIDRLRGDGPAVDRALKSRPAVEQGVARTLRAIPAALAAAADLAGRLGMSPPDRRPELERTLRVADLLRTDPQPEAGWLLPGQLGLLTDLAEEAARQSERARASRAALLEQFDEGVLTTMNAQLAERFENNHGSWLRHLSPGWYRDIGALRRHLTPERIAAGLDYDGALTAVRHWRELTAAESYLTLEAPMLARTFGRRYQGARTDWDVVRRALETVRALGDLLGDLTRWDQVSAFLLGAADLATLHVPTETLRAALSDLDLSFSVLDRVAGHDLADENPVSGAHRNDPGAISLRERVGMTDSYSLPAAAADLEGWLAALAPLWAASDQLHTCRKVATTSAAELLSEARDALACRQFEVEFGAATPALTDDLGPHFQGLRTEWPRVLTALTWTDRMRDCFGQAPPAAFVAAVAREPLGPIPERAELHRAIGRFQELRLEIGGSFAHPVGGGPWIGSVSMDQATLPAIAVWARHRHAELPKLAHWIDARTLLHELETAGLGGFVEAIRREAPPPDLWLPAFLRQVFTLWLTWRYEHAPPLDRFRREDFEQLVEELRALDRKQWELAAQRISDRLLAQRPLSVGVASGQSEVGLLLKEGRKQRRFKPLRRLFAEMPTLLPKLKPCLLMSPLSIAQHLGESPVTFDLVIFDEASQILPADAIGAIARGKQVVVVGDRRQLPPTRFFQVTSLTAADDDPDTEPPPESVLDACLNAGVPECSLLWHYRSRHEHLIAFSNAAFYDGRLRTFPSPDADRRVVNVHHVPDGVYDRGASRTNQIEARVVADLVVAHAEAQALAPPEQRQSLGVIAFSEAQMLQILWELEARKRARPELEPLLAEEGVNGGGVEEGLFVKNLESVQGDERDVILFSVGYGPDANGHLTMNFGPLNQPGGERRLNVAATRARSQLTVVSSVRSHQITLTPNSGEGLRQLKRYLEYAERGPAAILDGQDGTGREPSSAFEEAVQAALSAELTRTPGLERYEVVASVGVGVQPVDLAVRDETGRYVLAIECDGETFRDLPTARDRVRLRQETLSRLGWPLHRVWSTDWIVSPRDELRRLVGAVERGRQMRDGLLLDDAAPLSVLKPPDRPADGRTRPDLTRATGAAPTSQEAAMGREAALTTRPHLPRAGETEQCPTISPLLRTGEGAAQVTQARPISEVDDGEIADAIRVVLTRDVAMPQESLVVAVARALRFSRTGSRIKAAITSVIEAERRRGALTQVGDNLSLVDA